MTELRHPLKTKWETKEEEQKEKDDRNRRANQIASEMFAAMLFLPLHMRFLAVINSSRTDVGHPEQTYRMMVVDLLALAEAALPEDERISKLDVYVARRKSQGVQMTEKDDLDTLVSTLSSSAEVGLAARGLVDLIAHNLPGAEQKFNLKIKRYDQSWGFPVADFLANTVYNRVQDGSAASLDLLKQAGRFSQFISLGGYEERRSHIAARDADYGAALYWWAIAGTGALDKTKAFDYNDHFVRLLQKTAEVGGAGTTRAAVEAMIERFWQQAARGSAYIRIFRQLERVETALASFVGNPPDVRTLPLLFRLRNFMIAIANHIGDVTRGKILYQLQMADRSRLPFMPENLTQMLDLDLYEIEIEVNSLDLGKASQLAHQHFKGVEAYRAIWKQLNPNATEDFNASRLYHRAFSTLLRASILAAMPQLPEVGAPENDLSSALKLLPKFEKLPLHPADRKRAANYRIMALLRSRRTAEALKLGMAKLSEAPDAFDGFWAARAAADALAQGFDCRNEADSVLKFLYNLTGDAARDSHPYELLWREQGYLERHVHGNEEAAERCFKRSQHLLDKGKDLSPINNWLWHLLQLHRLENTQMTASDFVEHFPSDRNPGGRELAERAVRFSKSQRELTLLNCARLVSPY